MKQINQQGAIIVEAVLAVIVILAIGATIYAAHQKAAENKSSDSIATTNIKSTPVQSNPSDPTAAITGEVKAYFQGYNDTMLSGIKSGQNNSQSGAIDVAAKAIAQAKSSPDITDHFKIYLGGQYNYDPVLCAQNISDQPMTVDQVSITGETATAVVHQKWQVTASESQTTSIKVGLKEINGVWKIDSVTCSPQQ